LLLCWRGCRKSEVPPQRVTGSRQRRSVTWCDTGPSSRSRGDCVRGRMRERVWKERGKWGNSETEVGIKPEAPKESSQMLAASITVGMHHSRGLCLPDMACPGDAYKAQQPVQLGKIGSCRNLFSHFPKCNQAQQPIHSTLWQQLCISLQNLCDKLCGKYVFTHLVLSSGQTEQPDLA
jgi:hypothetical protein